MKEILDETTTPDEFDEWLSEETPIQRLSTYSAKALVVRPEVVQALSGGMKVTEVARVLGVSPGTVRRYMNTFDMKELMAIESRRIVRHLTTRDLGREKYLGLATALATLVDKVRLLNNEPTEITGQINQTTIQRIEIGLFGSGGRDGGKAVDIQSTTISAERLPEISEESNEKPAG